MFLKKNADRFKILLGDALIESVKQLEVQNREHIYGLAVLGAGPESITCMIADREKVRADYEIKHEKMPESYKTLTSCETIAYEWPEDAPQSMEWDLFFDFVNSCVDEFYEEHDSCDGCDECEVNVFELTLDELISQKRKGLFCSRIFEPDVFLSIQLADPTIDAWKELIRYSKELNSEYWHERFLAGVTSIADQY